MTSPLVSIITPVYNADRFVEQTIRSVLGQSYDNWELLLLIDAKSRDASLDICLEWAKKDHRITVDSSPENLGVAANRNRGIEIAKGEFIAFLDSDDVWHPNKLKKQIAFMLVRKSDFSCHTYTQMSEMGDILPVVRECPTKITYSDLLKTNSIGCLSVLVRSQTLKQFKFRTNEPHEDFILWLEILKIIPIVHGLNENLAFYRVLPSSRSGNKKQAAKDRWHIYRNVLKLSFANSLYYFVNYVVHALLQRRPASFNKTAHNISTPG